MNREEILREIDEAMAELRDVKAKVNEALCHARNIVTNEPQIPYSEAYNKGLEDGRNEAWELLMEMTEMSAVKTKEIYGYVCPTDVLNNLTPQEALAKLEAYEKAQEFEGKYLIVPKDDFTEYLINMGYNKGSKDVYNKAIDEFTERLSEKIKYEIDDCAEELDWIDEIAEQLKGGSDD